MQPDDTTPNLPTEPVLPTQPVMPETPAPQPVSQPAEPVTPPEPVLPTEPVMPAIPVQPAEAAAPAVTPEPAAAPVAPPEPAAFQPVNSIPPPAAPAPVAPIVAEQNNPLGLGIAALVLGLLFPPIGLIVGIAAIKKADPGTSGKITGIIGAILGGLGTLLILAILIFGYVLGKRVENSTNNNLTSASSLSGADDERVSDIKAIFTQLETYFDKAGEYPSLAQLNDPAWRAKNLPNLTQQQLQDPKGTSPLLVAAPQAGAYAYEVTGNNGQPCNNTSVRCAEYNLTATNDSGQIYQKTSLN